MLIVHFNARLHKSTFITDILKLCIGILFILVVIFLPYISGNRTFNCKGELNYKPDVSLLYSKYTGAFPAFGSME